MLKSFNEKEMRNELIGLYELFLKNPYDLVTIQKIISYEKEYGGLSTYNDYLESQPVSKDIEIALGWLSSMYQFNKHEKSHLLANDKILDKAKNILELLKNEI